MNPNGAACQGSTKPWCIGVSRLDSSSADIEEAYLEAIGAANEEIILAAAYFFPACVSAMHWWMPARAACA
jgi:phosphatidylserine/phosphatidylglycerophosphate/cardiolipin synthase-like enzyme